MTHRTLVSLACALLVCAAFPIAQPATSPQAPQEPRPKLVVMVVVDQLRAQHLEDYRGLFTQGINRLLTEGAWFRRGAYPYLKTVTCAGHSTIGTGTFPYRHGMILNTWYERSLKKTTTCTADPDVAELSYSGLKPVEGDSTKWLLQPTLASFVKKQLGGRIVAVSLKPRSTVPIAGKEADAITWFDDRGGWMTSAAYGTPSPAIQAFVSANPPAADFDKVWSKMLPSTAYVFEDDMPEERPIVGWKRKFPHPLRRGGKLDQDYYTRWQRSPFSDEYLGRMAAALVDSMKLGQGSGVDFLSVSFSALDLVGHAYGPRSHEVQDLLARLDVTIGRLLAHLDATLGRGGYVLGLSADHGVSEIPEQTQDGGRITSAEIKEVLQKVLIERLGPGEHVVSAQYTDHYLSPQAAERVQKDEQLRQALLDAMRGIRGVQAAFYGPDLASGEARRSSDPVVRAAALSHHAERSGDLILVPARRWITSSSAATHGTLHPYDQHVPVLLFGAGVKPGIYEHSATPADLAPSLAAIVGVTMGDVDGRALVEAFAAPQK